jgi:hypothetical protein
MCMQVPTIDQKPWYVVAFTPQRRTDPAATPVADVPEQDVTLGMLEEIAGEIMDLYNLPGADCPQFGKWACCLYGRGLRVALSANPFHQPACLHPQHCISWDHVD